MHRDAELDEEKQKRADYTVERPIAFVGAKWGDEVLPVRYIFAATDSEKYTGAVGSGCHSATVVSGLRPVPKGIA